MGRTRRRTVGLLVAAMVLVTAACNGETTKPSDLGDDSSTSAAQSSSTTSTTASAEEQAVTTAYKQFYDLLPLAGGLSDQEIVEKFSPVAGQIQVQAVVDYVAKLRANGQTTGGKVTFAPITVELAGGEAQVRECRDTTTEQVLDRTTGALIKDGAPGTSIEAKVAREDGQWKVISSSAKSHTC